MVEHSPQILASEEKATTSQDNSFYKFANMDTSETVSQDKRLLILVG